jgi:hypothetical protein
MEANDPLRAKVRAHTALTSGATPVPTHAAPVTRPRVRTLRVLLPSRARPHSVFPSLSPGAPPRLLPQVFDDDDDDDVTSPGGLAASPVRSKATTGADLTTSGLAATLEATPLVRVSAINRRCMWRDCLCSTRALGAPRRGSCTVLT